MEKQWDQFDENKWRKIKQHINTVSDQFDQIWRKRKRIIGTQLLILFIIKLVLSKNKQGYGSVLLDIWDQLLEKGIDPPQENAVAASSICEARKKLPPDVFLALNRRILEHGIKTKGSCQLWKGYRVFAVDGSKFNLPRPLVDCGYKTPGDHSYYPQGLVSCMYELRTAVPYDFQLVSHMDERRCAQEHFKTLKPRDLVVFDRGYFSYLMLKGALDKSLQAVFRL